MTVERAWLRGALLAAGMVMVLAGCGPDRTGADQPDPTATQPSLPVPTAAPVPEGEVSGTGLVLGGRRQAELCLGGVAKSLPPKCEGIPLDGWDWTAVSGEERQGRTRWGTYTVTGEYDGSRFRVTAVTDSPVEPTTPPEDPESYQTTCRTPSSGWTIDPERAGPAAIEAVYAEAARLPGYTFAWQDEVDGVPVINVAVAGDPAAAETRLREVYGGPLCVTRSRFDQAEVREISEQLPDLPGLLFRSTEVDRVLAVVTYDDGSLQDWADARFGPEVVVVSSALD